ncbi:hypothetical protein KY289_012119 [Solanum tuberosum]|nr:hypothetical protein KY289_012119 [Solanum tuberosum]
MFSEEELQGISVLQRRDDYVEVVCGCTSRRHGDAGARLRIFNSGELKIACECYPGCPEDNLTPFAFEKHAGKETSRWKNNIWVFIDGYKVPLIKTALLKYYNMSPKHAKRPHKFVHRDEFIKCTKCDKRRRFYRRSKKECRSYHDALANANFKCSDIPFDNLVIIYSRNFHVMMLKSEQVEVRVRDVCVPQHVEVALPVCALDVKYVVSQTVIVRLALTSKRIQKLKVPFCLSICVI